MSKHRRDKISLNSIAIKSDRIFIHSGTLSVYNSKQIAFILAHELAHIVLSHPVVAGHDVRDVRGLFDSMEDPIPEYLSSHPSSITRGDNIEKAIPKVFKSLFI
ncbi:uncharacterized protein LOC115231650 [Octopus sinensis]|uniref:Metalloendopeptidase OMA1, mitochondrial n=1 Tax=Octopus sinensis TaxID=2607531 RepID=A0A6P7TYC9_9MOLL|nr:uncharacterized protein LOC115231650 [Octopus sinensis]